MFGLPNADGDRLLSKNYTYINQNKFGSPISLSTDTALLDAIDNADHEDLVLILIYEMVRRYISGNALPQVFSLNFRPSLLHNSIYPIV